MRIALSLALSLLFVALLLNASLEMEHDERSRTRSAVHVVAAAKGRLLAPALYGGAEPLDGVIQVEDMNLTLEPSAPGLRVVTLSGSLAMVDHVNYDVGAAPDDVDAFVTRCENAQPGTVLVIASTNAFRPADADGLRRLQATAESLGSRIRPFDAMPSSWALLCVRRPEGWVKLAEGYSRESGVILAFTIDSDLSRYQGFEGETLLESTGLRKTRLCMELEQSSERRNVTLNSRLTVGGEARDAIFAPVGSRPEQFSRAVWDELPLGGDPAFRCAIGLRDGAWAESDGVVYSVLVNDRVAAERSLGVGGAPVDPGWLPWEVDLKAWEGLDVRFELRVSANGNPKSDWALWGEPTIESRTEPHPR